MGVVFLGSVSYLVIFRLECYWEWLPPLQTAAGYNEEFKL